MKIIPENPEAGDEIKLVCYTKFSYMTCDMENFTVMIQGNQIVVNIYSHSGNLASICYSVDTIPVGSFGAGDYELHTNLLFQSTNSVEATDSINFQVGNLLSIGEHAAGYNLLVHPNPFNKELHIQTDAVIEHMEIRSVSGQEILLNETFALYQKTIDAHHLENGLYILTLTDNKGNRYTKRVLKNDL